MLYKCIELSNQVTFVVKNISKDEARFTFVVKNIFKRTAGRRGNNYYPG